LLAPDGRCEVVRARREILLCLGTAGEPAENRVYGLCACQEHRVVELPRDPERRSGVLEPSREARRPGEPAVDDGLKLRSRGRLAKRLLEQLDGASEALELGEEQERLRANLHDLRLGQQLRRDRPCMCPFTGHVMGAGRAQRSPMALVEGVRRRQPERLLRELRCDRRGAATACHPRALVEQRRDLGVRCLVRECEVTRSHERVIGEARDPCMDLPPPLAEVAVEHRSQQRMREADGSAVAFDDLRGECRRECVGGDACPKQKGVGGRSQRRRQGESLSGRCRQPGDPRPQ
jgi:hypothetical protein